MCVSESAIGVEKRRVAGNSLVQQISCLLQFDVGGTAKTRQKAIFGATVEIKRGDVLRWSTFDSAQFVWRKLYLYLVGDCIRDLVLGDEHVHEIAIISLAPQLPIAARIS